MGDGIFNEEQKKNKKSNPIGELPFLLTNPSIKKEMCELVMGLSLEAEQRGMKLSDLLLEHDEKWLASQGNVVHSKPEDTDQK